MTDRQDEISATTGTATVGGQLVLSNRLAQFRRIYRWLNLTLVHQAIWPLLLLIASAPAGKPQEIPMPWYLARVGAPATAALLALLYLRRQPQVDEGVIAPKEGVSGRPSVAMQVKVGLLVLPVLLTVARIAAGPADSAVKLILFGIADVLAFQLIHFEVVRRSYRDPAQGIGLAVLLFAISWGLRDLLLTALGPEEASPALAFVSGMLIGGVVAICSRVLRTWPGGFWVAVAVHFTVIYLIIGFID
jgi:hypothetical protein